MTKTTDISSLNIYEKLYQVFKQVSETGVAPSKMKANNLNYNYISEAEITKQVNQLFVEYGLLLFPTAIGNIDRQYQVLDRFNKEGQKIGESTRLTTGIVVQYTIVNKDYPEETIMVTSVGDGSDSMDKAMSKAMTAVIKQLWRHMFLIPAPSADDPDSTPSTHGDWGGYVPPTNPAPLPQAKSDSPKDFIADKGKFKGMSLEEIQKDSTGPNWFDWALKNRGDNPALVEAITQFRKSIV